MADPQDLADLEFLVARYGNKIIRQQANFVQHTIDYTIPGAGKDDNAVPEARGFRRPIKVEKGRPGVDVVNVSKGGTKGVGRYDDNSARPVGGGRPKFQGRKRPELLSGVVLFGLAEVDIADGSGDGVDDPIDTIEAHGKMVGAIMARSIHNPQVAEPAADLAAASASMTVPRANGYFEGATYDVVRDVDSSVVFSFDAETVQVLFGGSATITFALPTTAIIDVSEHSIFLKGQGDPDERYGSIADSTDDTLDLYGLDVTTQFPAGLEEDVAGAWSNTDGKEAVAILDPFCQPQAWISSQRGVNKVVNAQNDNIRYIPGMGDNKRDPYNDALLPEFAGLPMVHCPTADDTTIELGDWSYKVWREHSPYRPRMPAGAQKGDLGKGSLFTSEGLHALKLLCDGFYSFVDYKRRSCMRFINVTS